MPKRHGREGEKGQNHTAHVSGKGYAEYHIGGVSPLDILLALIFHMPNEKSQAGEK